MQEKNTSSWKSRCCESYSSHPWQHLFAWKCKNQRLLNSHLWLISITRDAGDFKVKARTEIAHTHSDLWQGCNRSGLRKCKKAVCFSRALRNPWSSECSSLLDFRGTNLGTHGPDLFHGTRTWKVSSAVLSHRYSSTKPFLLSPVSSFPPSPGWNPSPTAVLLRKEWADGCFTRVSLGSLCHLFWCWVPGAVTGCFPVLVSRQL